MDITTSLPPLPPALALDHDSVDTGDPSLSLYYPTRHPRPSQACKLSGHALRLESDPARRVPCASHRSVNPPLPPDDFKNVTVCEIISSQSY
eukprot:640437-Hanusia_phi.AAC.1